MTDYNTQMMHSRQDDEDQADRLQDAINTRSLELQAHSESCDPLDGFNVIEALGEATNNETIILGKVLAERKFDQVGLLVEMITRAYWAKKADEQAEEELS